VEYNISIGAASVNDYFWIENVSAQARALRGYVRTAYVGNYGYTRWSITPWSSPRPTRRDELIEKFVAPSADRETSLYRLAIYRQPI